MLDLAVALVRAWTSLYTIGMPAALAAARRAEIESDLWEFTHALAADGKETFSDTETTAHVRRDPLPPSAHVLIRLLAGVPDDLLWRAELMDLRSRRRHTTVWIAAATAVLATGLWLRTARQPTELPELPRSPIKMQAWLNRPIPPPPPPPPPARYQRGVRNPPGSMPARAMPPPPAPKR